MTLQEKRNEQMGFITEILREKSFDLVKLSEVIEPLLAHTGAECFEIRESSEIFTDGWKMHKGHCRKPSDLQQFLLDENLNIN